MNLPGKTVIRILGSPLLLVGLLGLGALTEYRRFTAVTAASAEVAKPPPPGRAGRDHPESRAAIKPPSLSDPEYVAQRMKAEGYPSPILRQVVVGLLERRNGYFELEARYRAGERELRTEMRENVRRTLEELAQLTDYGQIKEPIEARQRRLKYGDLPEASVELLKRIESAGLSGAELEDAVRQSLPAAEADDYLRFNSTRAKAVQAVIRSVQVTEGEYDQLLSRAADEGRTTIRAMQDHLTVLGPERFLEVAGKLDPTGSSVDALLLQTGADPETRVRLVLQATELMEHRHRPATAPVQENLRALLRELESRSESGGQSALWRNSPFYRSAHEYIQRPIPPRP